MMNFFQRLKCLLKWQSNNIKGSTSLLRFLQGQLILFPILVGAIFLTISVVIANDLVAGIIKWTGLGIWLFGFVPLFVPSPIKEALRAVVLYLMYLYSIIALPVVTNSLNGDNRFILFQIVTPIFWSIIVLIVHTFAINKEGKYSWSEKKRKIILYLTIFPLYFIGIPAMIYSIMFSSRGISWIFWSLQMSLSMFLYVTWYYILYPLKHKEEFTNHSNNFSGSSKVIIPPKDTFWTDKQFDKNRFK